MSWKPSAKQRNQRNHIKALAQYDIWLAGRGPGKHRRLSHVDRYMIDSRTVDQMFDTTSYDDVFQEAKKWLD